MTKYPWRMNVRYDPTMGDGGTFLMRCEDCATKNKGSAFWPLTLEYWQPDIGLQRCRACHRDRRRHLHRQSIEQRRAQQRRHYHAIRDTVLAYRRAYYAANHERINAKKRADYASRKATHGSETP